MRRHIISFEGIDGSGKSTQTRTLVDRLKEEGFNVSHLQSPSRKNITGKHIINTGFGKGYDPTTTIMLFSYDILYSLNNLDDKTEIVVFDRYLHSAYASNTNLCRTKIEKLLQPLPLPDLTFYLKINPKEVLKRKDLDAEALELEWQIEKMKCYELFVGDRNFFTIVGTNPKNQITNEIYNIIKHKIYGGN